LYKAAHPFRNILTLFKYGTMEMCNSVHPSPNSSDLLACIHCDVVNTKISIQVTKFHLILLPYFFFFAICDSVTISFYSRTSITQTSLCHCHYRSFQIKVSREVKYIHFNKNLWSTTIIEHTYTLSRNTINTLIEQSIVLFR